MFAEKRGTKSHGRFRPHTPVADTYRLHLNGKNPLLYSQIINILASGLPDKQERIKNSVMLCKYAEVFEYLRKLTPEQVGTIAERLGGVLEVRVDLNTLQEIMWIEREQNAKRNNQLEQCEWMIAHGASNIMILNMCAMLTSADIKKMRLEMEQPVVCGRRKTLELEEQLTVAAYWSDLCRQEKDTYVRYQKLCREFPDYALSQMNTAISEYAK